MGSASQIRAGVPAARSALDAVPRPRLFRMLDEQRSLTVVQAPKGFGKRVLVASWLHRGGAPDRQVIWVDYDTSPIEVPDLVDDTPCLVVLNGVEPADAPAALKKMLILLEHCPAAIAVVTVHGAVELPPELAAGGLDHSWVSAHHLCFSPEEMEQLCRSRGLAVTAERRPELCSELGGVPSLVASAVAVLRVASAAATTIGHSEPALEQVVGDYVHHRLSGLGEDARAIALKVAVMTTFTDADATEYVGGEASAEFLDQLGTVGLILGTFDGVQRRWSWPPAVREVVLGITRAHMPAWVDETLTRLARERRDADRHAEAAVYAAEARRWDVAARILDENWSRLVASDFEVLVRLLRAVPDSVTDEFPGLAAGKALFVNALTGHPLLDIEIPSDPNELTCLGTEPDAAAALHIGTVQAIALRLAGNLREAGDRALAMVPLVESMLVHQPGEVTAQLPTLRLQWAIGMQLAGDLGQSTVQFEQAYRDALTPGSDYVVLNAAGSLAANWALSGDLTRADEWLSAGSRVDINVGYWDEMIRVAGRVGAALAHMDRLDAEGAAVELDQLGVPAAGEELWGLVAYAHTQYALTAGDAYAGLTVLHRIVDGHRRLLQDGSLSHVLLTAAEIDLHLALGHGNLARAVAETDTTGHPLVVVASARMELLTGNPEAARTVLKRISWPDSGWLRAHIEALLIEAGACLLTDRDAAVRAWSRGTTLAEALGNRRVLMTVPADTRRELAHVSGAAVPENLAAEVFPLSVPETVLTAREREILLLLANGVARKDLAKTIYVSNNTVKTHLRRINVKLGTGNAVTALARAQELGLLS